MVPSIRVPAAPITTPETPPTIDPCSSTTGQNPLPKPAIAVQSTQQQLAPPQTQIQRRTSTRPRKPVTNLNLRATVLPPSEKSPSTVTQALKVPRWRKAMQEEIDSLNRNHTFDLVSPKRLPNGAVDMFKARLVAKGFHQRPGIVFHDTISLVVKPATICLVVSVSVSRGWPFRQLDVNNAFLQGKLEDEVFMTQPLDFHNPDNPTAICKLHKAIYGLKQALRAWTWYNELRTFLIQSCFTNSY